MLRGKTFLHDPAALGVATEAAVFKHLLSRCSARGVRLAYWKGRRDREVDFVAQTEDRLVPLDVKYRSQPVDARSLAGLIEFCAGKGISRGYVATRSLEDFGPLDLRRGGEGPALQVMRIPAPLLCYWLGAAEVAERDGEPL